MIENEELGVKIAENPVEALWARVRDSTAQRITELKNTLIVEEAVLKMAEEKAGVKSEQKKS